LSVTEDTELVTPPSSDDVSESASAEAAGDEKVSQVRVAAPARSTGRRARHGETALAMRTTPSTVAFDNAYSVRPDVAGSLGSAKTNRQKRKLCTGRMTRRLLAVIALAAISEVF
jgi:hypothetical protein